MNHKTRLTLLLLGAFVPALSSAGIDGTMAQGIRDRELCVVDNIDVQPEFREALVRSLAARGYTARFVAERGACDVALAFNAAYGVAHGWGPRRVLKSATFVVYRDSQSIATMRFRYERSMFGFGSNGSVEEVISQMVFKLLPRAP